MLKNKTAGNASLRSRQALLNIMILCYRLTLAVISPGNTGMAPLCVHT